MQNLFREIHKNSWLKRVDHKKVLQKKFEKVWVVFCVHDDCEAFLEGFIEPRSASTHSPDWSISLQTTQHISHALVVSNEQEFEFVVTLAGDVVRFSAPTWELMLEWVECLRSKLREMKILSPKENLYSKLPEIRPPLLPTRDPTSPLPAPPPIPAGLIPGIERVLSTSHTALATTSSASQSSPSTSSNIPATSAATTTTTAAAQPQPSTSTAMSNTSIQNIMNLLSNPLSAVSKALNNSSNSSSSSSGGGSSTISSVSSGELSIQPEQSESQLLIKTFTNNVQLELHEFPSASNISVFQQDAPSLDLDCSSNESNSISIQTEPIVIPRPHTSRTSTESKNKPYTNKKSAPTAKSSSKNNQTVAIKATEAHSAEVSEESNNGSTNITIIQVSNTVLGGEGNKPTVDEDYKSNVQIIPSNISPPPPIIPEDHTVRYNSPTRTKVISISGENSVNRVQVNGVSDEYGKIKLVNVGSGHKSINPTKTVIISTAAEPSVPSAITTVVENSTNKTKTNISITSAQHYEEVFLSTSVPLPINGTVLQHPPITYSNHIQRHNVINSSNSNSNVVNIVNTNQSTPNSLKQQQQRSTSHCEIQVNRTKLIQNNNNVISINNSDKENATTTTTTTAVTSTITEAMPTTAENPDQDQQPSTSSTARQILGCRQEQEQVTEMPTSSNARQILLRGQTEMIINRTGIKNERTSRSSRQRTANNSDVEKLKTESGSTEDPRKRSSSTSDAAAATNRNRATPVNNDSPRRLQQPPQPYRPENPQSSGRMSLREQQVFQLRREMNHPGGVRLQLRRKDCLGSIAWVEAFGGVWVAGWKQREHPVLYNALHIGDQLISISGTQVATPAEANKLIRQAPGLFVEILIRRVPFGRVYAIRREMEGQCLGLIRDGNTAIVVDVVPNSLAARFGLPPKTQTCDKSALTFWVLTEINGRPLNLFFRENEIKDRLNSVGRDISILVQPSDLIAKLKKQLKSLRGHKDFIVQ